MCLLPKIKQISARRPIMLHPSTPSNGFPDQARQLLQRTDITMIGDEPMVISL